jgi:double-strand break repair protein MRE11
MLPLIRLRVDYSSPAEAPFEVGNPQRFGQDFTGRVANPRDIVQFHKKKVVERRKKTVIDQPEGMEVDGQDEEDELSERIERVKVETLVREYLSAQQLQVIAENEMGSAVDAFVDKQEKDAIKACVCLRRGPWCSDGTGSSRPR